MNTEQQTERDRRCLRCGGAMISGTIAAPQPLTFSVPPPGFLSVGAISPVEGQCCESCGWIELMATRLEKLTKKAD